MKPDPKHKPDFDSLKDLLIEIAEERSVDRVLEMMAQRLCERFHIALIRIWLIRPGDSCGRCPMAHTCEDRNHCLHLVAGASDPEYPDVTEDGPEGGFSRFPLGIRKIGRIISADKPEDLIHLEKDYAWLVRPEWVCREKILGFAAQPLTHKGEVLGVLAIFTRFKPTPDGPIWMRMIADHAGTAIANARAFEETEKLRRQLEQEKTYLQEELSEARFFGEIVGQSHALRRILKQVDLAAPTDTSVVILGEPGTGKELIAREIHKRSLRKERPMIKVNCASIPGELYETELFGHVKGAFTGAVMDRAGRFEAAGGGTLFLDEVGEIPLELQSKLLRVLQQGRYVRVGEETARRADVRIIASSHKDLKREVEEGRFRQDLYDHLNVFPIEIPPLRKRREDIPALAVHFAGMIARKLGRPGPHLTRADILKLQAYEWPGNLRELRNCVERAVITSQTGVLEFDPPEAAGPARRPLPPVPAEETPRKAVVVPEAEIKRGEIENLKAALRKTGWKIYGPGGAAELLGVKPTTLASRIKKLNIKKPHP